LSGHWKCNGVGGATKVQNNPCHCCLVTTATLLSYSTDYAKYEWCSELIRIGWITPDEVAAKSFKCINCDMLTTELLPTLKQELLLAKQELPSDYVPIGVVPPLLQSPIDFDSPTTILTVQTTTTQVSRTLHSFFLWFTVCSLGGSLYHFKLQQSKLKQPYVVL
jgi:hypothetical protein